MLRQVISGESEGKLECVRRGSQRNSGHYWPSSSGPVSSAATGVWSGCFPPFLTSRSISATVQQLPAAGRFPYNMAMRLISLQSGSNGNCIYVEAGGIRLLFDAGLSGVQVEERLALQGRDVRGIDAVLISHDHSDHSRAMGIYQRKFGLPVYVTAKTLDAAQASGRLGDMDDVRHFEAGGRLRFATVTVETIPTPHDGAMELPSSLTTASIAWAS